MARPLLINLMLSNDGNTLLGVRQAQDGSLELLSTPVEILQNAPVGEPPPLPPPSPPPSPPPRSKPRIKSIVKIKGSNDENKINHLSSLDLKPKDSKSQSHETTVENKLHPHETPTDSTSCKTAQQNSTVLEDIPFEENVLNKKTLDIIKGDGQSQKKHKKHGKSKKKSKSAEEKRTGFKCEICGQEFKKQYILKKHMQEHAQEKPHHCPKCPASFNVPTNFALHMATHSTGQPKCPECGRKFARIATLKAHVLIHELDESLYCTECDDTFETKSQLDAHLKLHNEKCSSEELRRCKLCRKQFTQAALYRQHLRDHYRLHTKFVKPTRTGSKLCSTYKCKICLKIFSKPSQLTRHIRVHTGEKPYECHLCHRTFSQKGSVRIHMWQHNGTRPYSCSLCHAKFTQKGNLNSHMDRVHRIQEGATMYRCSHCSCTFKRLGSLNCHIKRMHSSGKSSNQCTTPDQEMVQPKLENCDDGIKSSDEITNASDQNFKNGFEVSDENKGSAIVTIIDKLAEDPEKSVIKIKQSFVNNTRCFECTFCEKTFKKPSDLIRHSRVHTKEKPFKCKTCGRSFSLKANLETHDKVHKSKEPLSCSKCNMYFGSKNRLTDHEKDCQGLLCLLCGKKMASLTELKNHSAEHFASRDHEKKTLKAEVKNLAPKIQLQEPLVLTEVSNGTMALPKYHNDIARSKGRPHKCPTCPAAFMKLSHLKQHHRKHTGERPFQCDVCQSCFACKSSLKTHLRVHDLLKPYECEICQMNFSTLSSMKRHRVTHSNKRPFMCPYCNKTFKTTVNCKKHMNLHKHEIAQQQLGCQKTQIQIQKPQLQIQNPQLQIQNPQLQIPNTIANQHFIQPLVISEPITVHGMSFEHIKSNTIQNPFFSSYTSSNINLDRQTLPIVDNPIACTTQTLHANETSTFTISNSTGDQTFTLENIGHLEESLNQQLLNLKMNLDLNSSTKQLEEQSNGESQNQPILSIIYENKPISETSFGSSNVLTSQFDSYDISQFALSGIINNGIDQISSTSMASILPDSVQWNQSFNQQPNNLDLNAVLKQYQLNTDNLFSISENNQVSNQNIVDRIEDKDLQCHMCKKENFTADSLKEHLKTHQSNREFECTHCSYKFCSSRGLSRHIKSHESQETHKCYECQQEFSTSLLLREHIKDHVKNELKLKSSMGINDIIDDIPTRSNDDSAKKSKLCQYCNKTFRKPSDLVRHLRTHTGERPFKCEHCNKGFSVKCTLDSHLKIHKGERFDCHVCNSIFTTKGSLKVHLRLHTGAKPFKCSLCDMKFRTSGHRNVHFASHTRDPNPIRKKKKLSEGDQTEDNPDDNQIQLSQVSDINGPEPQQTDFQDASTLATTLPEQIFIQEHSSANELSLENNQLVVNLQYLIENGLVSIQSDDGIKPAVSTSAQEQVVFTNETPTELNEVTPEQVVFTNEIPTEPNEVTQEQVVFTNKIPTEPNEVTPEVNGNDFQLNNCMILQLDSIDSTVSPRQDEETKDTTSNRRECEICGKAFRKPCQVERHMRTHTGERPFKCEQCGKGFAQKSTLNMHKKHHAGVRPYACPHCNRSFTQSGNLQTHMKRVHKIDPVKSKKLSKGQQFFLYDPEQSQISQISVEEHKLLNFDDMPIDIMGFPSENT